MELEVSTPGRICLFGEHQDYLLLPVIPCAISLRISIAGKTRDDLNTILSLPDIQSSESFRFNGTLKYTRERDYFRSVVNVLQRYGFTFSRGFDCIVQGKIPINSGTSSSSALIVSWVNFLSRMSDQAAALSPELIAKYAYESEVAEFNEPGGMMDHFSTSIGGTIFLSFYPSVEYIKFPAITGTFVLGDSGQPKDTKYILSSVKNQIIKIAAHLKNKYPNFSLHTVDLDSLDQFRDDLQNSQFELLKGTVSNRNITLKAKDLLLKDQIDKERFGALLNEHQANLRDKLKISTNKIDLMVDAALQAGALGAKINGSGGGGCMFAYAPINPEKVAEAITNAGGQSYIITPDQGTIVNGKFDHE